MKAVGNVEWAKELHTQLAKPQGETHQLIDASSRHTSAIPSLSAASSAKPLPKPSTTTCRPYQPCGRILQSTLGKEKVGATSLWDFDVLTKDFQRGQQLFISQACYACHRIAGFSRGGVGPELTNEGFADPWFIKESIYCPQADLRTSTMPNMNLDHPELEDLTTFLVGQKGKPKSVSKVAIAFRLSWEAGKKLPSEKPLPPSELHDL